MKNKKQVEVCFSPALFKNFEDPEAIVVVNDILRATSAIVTAFINGVEKLIPVGTIEEAHAFKKQGYMVAAERDGIVKDFADFGNSPFNFTKKMVNGKTIVYSTTNGTKAIKLSSNCHKVAIGAYLNITALKNWLVEENRPVIILCAGWKDKFNLEDTLFAGALAEKLLGTGHFHTICDSTHASIDLWKLANGKLMEYVDKTAQKTRLKKNNLDDVIEYCHTPDLTDIIPVLKGDEIVRLHEQTVDNECC